MCEAIQPDVIIVARLMYARFEHNLHKMPTLIGIETIVLESDAVCREIADQFASDGKHVLVIGVAELYEVQPAQVMVAA